MHKAVEVGVITPFTTIVMAHLVETFLKIHNMEILFKVAPVEVDQVDPPGHHFHPKRLVFSVREINFSR